MTMKNDVVQKVCENFCLSQGRGELAVSDRNELWRVLVRITLCKVRNAVERQGRQRRDYHRERAPSAADGDGVQHAIAGRRR
ncbi:MAG TPA: hypothetical protein VFI31_29265 [Pirellulales bacterium]|nr:hypothetical protein [Pirellulales bacterium]